MNENLCSKKLHVLYELSRVLGNALNLEKTLEDVLKVLSETLSMKRATLTLLSAHDRVLQIRASHGLTAEEMRRGRYRLDEGVTGRIFRTGQPFVIPDISAEPLFMNKTGARRIVKGRISFLGVPIMAGGEPIGVLNVDKLFGDEISFEEDVEFLTVVATLIAQLVSLNREVLAREEQLMLTNRSLKEEISEKYQHFFIVGASAAMRQVQELISKVANSRASVLLLGESGTGKTLVARILHELSPRNHNPFIKLNCAALPENLLESELFGYEKGAFTGADKSKPGRIEQAQGGTLFLDEIGELPLLLQTKLLRFLQEREFERLGSNKTLKVDVRIVTATNCVLTEAVAEGKFREDLYYRLNVFPIEVPALRNRRSDIEPLLTHFLGRFGREYGRNLSFSDKALNILSQYDWPGNVREMENLIERLAILAEKDILSAKALPPHILNNGHTLADDNDGDVCSLKAMEKREILSALQRNEWIQARAARELGLTVRQMGYRVKKLGLKEKVFMGKHESV